MSNLFNEVSQHLTDDVIMQLSRQIGAQDANQVKKAAGGITEVLLDIIAKNANNQQSGGGLFGAIERDHDGGILGNILGVLKGQTQVNNPKTLNGEGIISHLLGAREMETAQIVSKYSGLNIFKSGVLMQLIAPIVMGVVGGQRKSNGLDLGGLAKVLMGGAQQQRSNPSGGLIGQILDRDGDGNMMDDLLSMGMKVLMKR